MPKVPQFQIIMWKQLTTDRPFILMLKTIPYFFPSAVITKNLPIHGVCKKVKQTVLHCRKLVDVILNAKMPNGCKG